MWKGVIIKESLENKDLLKLVKIVSTKRSSLETEEGILNFHSIDIEDRKKNEFVENAKKCIKNSWYIHICKAGRMIVIFKGKSFEFTKGDDKLKQENMGYQLVSSESSLVLRSLLKIHMADVYVRIQNQMARMVR